jgi:mRNA interferase RelE/StbE
VLRIDLSRPAAKFLQAVPPKHGRQIAAKIAALRDDPEPHDSIRMKGEAAAFRRADVGEYRIVYQVEGDLLRIVLVGRRNDSDVYRRLERRIR